MACIEEFTNAGVLAVSQRQSLTDQGNGRGRLRAAVPDGYRQSSAFCQSDPTAGSSRAEGSVVLLLVVVPTTEATEKWEDGSCNDITRVEHPLSGSARSWRSHFRQS